MFSASQKINSDPAKKITTRRQFMEFIKDLGNVLSFGEQYQIKMGEMINATFGTWMTAPGPFTDEDRARVTRELEAMALAFDSI